MADKHDALTEEENEKLLSQYFKEGLDGPMSSFPTKEKKKLVVLEHIMKRFEKDKMYTEKEVNGILEAIYQDHVSLRRYLIVYGYMSRQKDGSAYWVKTEKA